MHVLAGAGCAQGGHGIGKAQLGQRHHVHIALAHQGVAAVAQGGAGFVQAIQLAPFVKQRGFGGVEVFGLFIPKDAPAKADALAFDIANREHDAVAKTVVALALVLVRVVDDQAALFQQAAGVVGEDAGQKIPARRGVPQAKAAADRARDTPAL